MRGPRRGTLSPRHPWQRLLSAVLTDAAGPRRHLCGVSAFRLRSAAAVTAAGPTAPVMALRASSSLSSPCSWTMKGGFDSGARPLNVSSPSPPDSSTPQRCVPRVCRVPPEVQRMRARRALASRLASGPLPDLLRLDRSYDGFVKGKAAAAAAASPPPLAMEVRAAAKRAALALRQTRRLLLAGHLPAEEETCPSSSIRDEWGSARSEDGNSAREALFTSGSGASAGVYEAGETAAIDGTVSDLRCVSYGAVMSGGETLSLLQYCAGELTGLADTLEAAVVARQRRSEARCVDDDEDEDGGDGSALRAPRELREAQRRLHTKGADASPSSTVARASPFRDPWNAVDLLEVASLLLSLLGQYLHVLVDDVLVAGVAADSAAEERALRRIAYGVTARVASALRETVVAKVLAGVAEAERMRLQSGSALHNTALTPPRKEETREGGNGGGGGGDDDDDDNNNVAFTASLLRYGRRRLVFTDDTVLLAVCSQRGDGQRALQLAGLLLSHNTAVTPLPSHHLEHVIAPLPVDLVASQGSNDVLMTLAYVLAQHGEWSCCLQLLNASSSRERNGGEPPPPATAALAELLFSIALANAQRQTWPAATQAPSQDTPNSSSPLREVEEVVKGWMPRSAGGDGGGGGGGDRGAPPVPRQALLYYLVSHGVTPNRPLSVSEYGALLKQFLRSRTTPLRAEGGHKAADEQSSSRGDGDDAGWMLSPSSVWRRTAGLADHVRTTLCLAGFQALVRHGLAGSMSVEDLLVVLSLTRRVRRQRSHALQQWQRCRRVRPKGGLSVGPPNTEGGVEALAEGPANAVGGALPLFLLPAMCSTPPAGREHLVTLCEAYRAVCQQAHPFASGGGPSSTPGRGAGHHGRGSAVLLSVLAHELLSLLKAARYERAAGVFWKAVLTAVGAIIPHEGLTADTVHTLEDLVKALIHVIREEASAGTGGAGSVGIDEERRDAWCVGRRAAETTPPSLLAPLVSLAPCISPFVVALVVQSPAGRLLSPWDCLRLIPYVPLSSRSQTQLLRLAAQHRWQSPAGAAAPLGGPAPPEEDTSGNEGGQEEFTGLPSPAASDSLSIAAAAAANALTMTAARAKVGSSLADEQQMLSLLMDTDSRKALQRYRESSPRVRAVGAPHVVRLIVEADAWRDVEAAELRALVRLAVRVARAGGGGGAADSHKPSGPLGSGSAEFVEAMLHTALERGLWATGVGFHQLLAEEQPALMRRCRRASHYAALLRQGLGDGPSTSSEAQGTRPFTGQVPLGLATRTHATHSPPWPCAPPTPDSAPEGLPDPATLPTPSTPGTQTPALCNTAAVEPWAVALRVLERSARTRAAPLPSTAELAMGVACPKKDIGSYALLVARQCPSARSPQRMHAVLSAYVVENRWNDAVTFFYDCVTRRGIQPLDASVELALMASEAAGDECKGMATVVGAMASTLEDVYTVSGAGLDHIAFVQQQHRRRRSGGREEHGGAGAHPAQRMALDGIPEFVLQPTYSDPAAGADGKPPRRNAGRDPRYERLRRLLADHTSGVMLVMHLETKGYGLALYASEVEALDACRTTITPEQPGMQYPPLTLRIVEREKPLPPEPVYTPCLTIEGEQVLKASLAITRGLELAYRGRSVPKWCPNTLEGRDCHFGMNCHRIHRSAVQRTVRKRPRIDSGEASGGAGGGGGGGGSQLTASEAAEVNRLLRNAKLAEEVLVPETLRVTPPGLYVPVTVKEVEDLLLGAHGDTHAVLLKLQHALDQTPEGSQLSQDGRALFVRLSFPGGAPWDWSLGSEEGLAALRQRCPLPANGAPTPLERDLLCQKLFYHMNCLNAFHKAEEAVRALTTSANVAQGFSRFLRTRHSRHGDGSEEEEEDEEGLASATKAAAAAADGEASEAQEPLFLVVRPWLRLPTVGCEVSAFLERGGHRVRGVVQRYGQLRLMIPASTCGCEEGSAAADKALSRFVVLGAEEDEKAEAAMEEEIRHSSRLFAHAVEALRRHISRQSQRGEGGGGGAVPAGAAWCAQLALELAADGGDAQRAVVLSFKPYQRALEECPMYTHLSNSNGDVTEVSWNTQKHAYVPLFSREVLEKLKQ